MDCLPLYLDFYDRTGRKWTKEAAMQLVGFVGQRGARPDPVARLPAGDRSPWPRRGRMRLPASREDPHRVHVEMSDDARDRRLATGLAQLSYRCGHCQRTYNNAELQGLGHVPGWYTIRQHMGRCLHPD